MPIIDAECHFIETELTWEYFTESERQHKPLTLEHSMASRLVGA